jgi:predicted nucleic acid-binding protein
MRKLRVFIDSDVLFAGSATSTPNSASQIILKLSELTLIEAVISQQVVDEVERNLRIKVPLALPKMSQLLARCVEIVPLPPASFIDPLVGLADAKDVTILAAAIQSNCTHLATFNVRHYRPGHPTVVVVQPGDFVTHARQLLTQMDE